MIRLNLIKNNKNSSSLIFNFNSNYYLKSSNSNSIRTFSFNSNNSSNRNNSNNNNNNNGSNGRNTRNNNKKLLNNNNPSNREVISKSNSILNSNNSTTATTTTTTATPPTTPESMASNESNTSTPLAPILPHASHGLIQLDTFFAGGRPLLELPIRLSARKTVTPFTRLFNSSNHSSSFLDESETMETLDGEELVEMVDIAPDGTPLGPSYITTLAASQASEPIRTSEEEEELKDLQREATEAALQDIEDGLPDPYEAWLIAKRTPELLSPSVSRYLASHPPFQLPSVPQPRIVNSSSTVTTIAANTTIPNRSFSLNSSLTSSLSRQTLSDLAFLRPFPSATISSPPTSITSDTKSQLKNSNKSNSLSNSKKQSITFDFASQFVSPLPPSIASEFTSKFLTNAIQLHTWRAETSYELTAAALDKAMRNYKGITGRRKGLSERRKKGEVRVWEEHSGWKTVDLGSGKNGEGLFLPAEMVDLDWEDEQLERKESSRRIGMDSTKRKRKKKITKHKYKKRRKAQKALRQRLGK